MVRTAALAFAIITASSAQAATWSPVGETAAGGKIWIDTGSIRRDSAGVEVWYKLTRTDGLPDFIALVRFSCESRLVALRHSVTYDQKGGAKSEYDSGLLPRPEPLVPDTVNELVFGQVCSTPPK